MQPLSFKEKVEEAISLIRKECWPGRAVVMSSFGKDSMVLLGLVEEAGLKFPVINFREPYHREKYKFADKVIAEKELVVYDYPPLGTGLVKKGNKFEVINFHQISERDYVSLPTGIIPPCGGKWVCVLDILSKPVGTFAFPWEHILIGHKASDQDPIWGSVEISNPVRKVNGKKFIYPLIHFTDEDVWEYHRSRELPIHVERYNPATGEEWADKSANPDYFPCCTSCVDRDLPENVYCPRLQNLVRNVWTEINYLDPVLPDYIGRKKDA